MTFFLSDPGEPPKIKAQNPENVTVPSFAGGLGAAISDAALTNDANFRSHRETIAQRDRLATEAAKRLGVEAFRPILEERNQKARDQGLNSQVRDIPTSVEDLVDTFGPNFSVKALEIARKAAAADPDAWADLDLSDEAITASVNEQLKAEHEDNQQILAMMPSGRGFAELLGGMIGATADVRNLPFLALGGGSGSIMRVAGREAMLNAAGEAMTMPSQFDMAERLDIPAPDVATQLTIAAAAGGVLGGLMGAGERGIAYWKARNSVQSFPGRSDIETRILVDQAEDILDATGSIDEVVKLAGDNPPLPRVVPKPSDTAFRDGQVKPWENSEDPGVQLRDAPDETQLELQSAIDEARAIDNPKPRPLLDFLANNHKRSDGAESFQVHPDGPAGQELKNRGLTSKTMPGLFSKNGRKDFDNLVASEMEEMFPGITDATNSRDPSLNGYLDRQGVLDTITRSADGDNDWLLTRARVSELEAQMEDYVRFRDEARQNFDPLPEEGDGPTMRAAMQDIADGVAMGLRGRGLDDLVSPQQKEDMVQHLAKNGGSVEDLLDDMDNADLKFAEADLESDDGRAFAEYTADDFTFTPDVEEPGAGGGGIGGPEPDGRTTGGGQGSQGPDTGATERTDAGTQQLIDGVAPITDRDRLQAQQAAPLRGGSAAADDGLFDLGARDQRDMFSDPAGPEAKAIHDAISNDLRTRIEAEGDLDIDLGDGRSMAGADLLDELEADTEFEAVMELCGGPK